MFFFRLLRVLLGLLFFPFTFGASIVHFILICAKAGRYNIADTRLTMVFFLKHIRYVMSVVRPMTVVWWRRLRNCDGQDLCDLPAVKSLPFEKPYTKSVRQRDEPLPSMTLDVFPMPAGSKAPVIVFLYGGGFSSGAGWYYYTMARRIRLACKAVVVIPDYPTYPRGTIQEMSETIGRCLMWTRDNAEKYGGSRDHIWVVGHSAGAYLTAYTVLRSMMAKASNTNALPEELLVQGECNPPLSLTRGRSSVWAGSNARHPGNDKDAMPNPSNPVIDYAEVPCVEGCILLSGVYDLGRHIETERSRGIELLSGLSAATGGYWDASNLPKLCEAMIRNKATYPLTQTSCPRKGFHVMHSTGDETVWVREAEALIPAFRCIGKSFWDLFGPN